MSEGSVKSESAPPRRRGVAAALLAVAFAAAAAAWWVAGRFTHSITNDAFVESHLINVAPEVYGRIVEIFVQENSPVRKGQVLARIDATPFEREHAVARSKLASAEALLEESRSELAVLSAEVPRRIAIAAEALAVAKNDEIKASQFLDMTRRDVEKAVAASHSEVEGARARLTLAQEDYQRFLGLSKEQSIPERRYEEATRDYKVQVAGLNVAEARLGQAQASRNQIAIAEQSLRNARQLIRQAEQQLELARVGELQIETARRKVAVRTRQVEESRRSVELAKTNVDYARLTAPYDGVIAKKWRHLGDYVAAGEPIVGMYNPKLLYVTANLEETKLPGVAPGNEVRIDVDAVAGPYRGRVLWIGTATDANFSLIPRDVSAGEYTKVVQRVPIRIWIAPDERFGLLRPGLSTTVSISHGPGDAAWAAEAARREALTAGITEPSP